MRAGKAYLGTSGWIYKHWKDNWYKEVKPKDYLKYMTQHFNALEANGTFYRLSKKETFESWYGATPPDFRFAIKAHRYLTHRKKLKDISEGIQRCREPALGLKEKLACVVWQLPGQFQCNLDRLESFLEELKGWPEARHAVEFRHKTWFSSAVAKCLEQAEVAVCLSDSPKWPMWEAITTDLVYVRLHGHEYLYASPYSEEQLQGWARKIEKWLNDGCDVHVYFDNDWHANAPYDAEKLKALLLSSYSAPEFL